VVHGSDLVEVREVNSLSVLYRVRGSEAGKLPYVLTGHLDVVPAVPDKWTQPPFSGNVIDGFIYGRGAIDDKGSVMVLYLSFFSIPAFHFFFLFIFRASWRRWSTGSTPAPNQNALFTSLLATTRR